MFRNYLGLLLSPDFLIMVVKTRYINANKLERRLWGEARGKFLPFGRPHAYYIFQKKFKILIIIFFLEIPSWIPCRGESPYTKLFLTGVTEINLYLAIKVGDTPEQNPPQSKPVQHHQQPPRNFFQI